MANKALLLLVEQQRGMKAGVAVRTRRDETALFCNLG